MSTVEYVILEPQAPGYLFSTGPKSAAGKARASMNALKRGLRSKKVVLPTEDRAEFDDFRQALIDDLRPTGAEETLLADTIAGLHWKMARFERAEYELLTKEEEEEEKAIDAGGAKDSAAAGEAGENRAPDATATPAVGKPKARRTSATPLADALLARGKELALVLRYRGQALRELERARREFRLLQQERRAREAAEAERRRQAEIPGTPEFEAEEKRRKVERAREERETYEEMKKEGDPMADDFLPPMWTFAPEWVDPEEAEAMEKTLSESRAHFEELVAEKMKAGTLTAEQAENARKAFLAQQMRFRKNGY